MIVSHALKIGTDILRKNNISTFLLDAEILLSNATDLSREKLITNEDFLLKRNQKKIYFNYLRRRLKKEPVSQILNYKEFWSLKFYITKEVLCPRPVTELLVENIVKLNKKFKPQILDLGSGSGCIIISILKQINGSRGVALDISNKSIKITKKNSQIHGLKKRIKFLNRPCEAINGKKFDIIVSNPPYIKTHELQNLPDTIKLYEPKIALNGGVDGLDLLKKVIYKSKGILKKNGLFGIEIGNKQYLKISEILKRNNFREIKKIKDSNNNIRCIISTLKN